MPELSYAQGPSAPLWDLTLSEMLAQTAARFPVREALVVCHQNLRLTWRECDDEVTLVARGLAGLGLRSGDRVGIWSTNCAEWVLGYEEWHIWRRWAHRRIPRPLRCGRLAAPDRTVSPPA